jgi:dUTPase
VTLSLASNPSGATLGGALIVNTVNGRAIFNGLTIDKLGSGYTLRATAAGLTASTSAPFDVTNQLVLTTAPPSTVVAGTPFGLVVKVEDGQGNVDTSFNGSVTIANDDPSYGGPLHGLLTVTAINGVAIFGGLTLNSATDFALLRVRAAGIRSVVTQFVEVIPAAPAKVVISGPRGFGSNNAVASPFGLDVFIEDAFGNTSTNYNGSVTLSLSNNPSNATLGGTLTVNAVDGEATFGGLTINKLGSGYRLTAASGSLTPGTSASFDVAAQAGVIVQPPEAVDAGSPFIFKVAAENGVGNVDPSYNGNITITLSNFFGGPTRFGGVRTVRAVNGIATFDGLTVDVAGTYGFVVSGDGLIESTTDVFDVRALAASQLVVLSPPPGVVTRGAGFGVSVGAEDAFGNLNTSFNGPVTLSLAANPGGATLGGTLTVNALAGVATFTGLTISAVGSGYALQVASGGLTPATTNPISVTAPGAATQLVVTGQPPTSVGADGAFGLVVKAQDGLGAVDSLFNGSVTVALSNNPSGGTLAGTLTVNAVNGVATFANLKLDRAGYGYALSASANGLRSGSSDSFNVTPLAATQLAVQLPVGNLLTGGPFEVRVMAQDARGNVDPSFTGPVTLSLSTNPTGATLGGTLTVNAVNGVARFTALTIDKSGAAYALRATTTPAAGLSAGTSPAFAVSNDQLVVTTQVPSTVAAGGGFGLTVTAKDGTGAADASFNGNVTVSLLNFGDGTPTLGGTLTIRAVNGVATFAGLSVNRAGKYALSVNSPGLPVTATGSFTVNFVPTQLVLTVQPPGVVTRGAGFAVAVSAEDAFGNLNTSFNGPVALSLAANPGGAALGGTLTVNAVAGVATFTGLTISSVGSGYTLQAASGGLTPTTTNPITVTAPGAATQLVVTGQPPASVSAGGNFGLVVKAEDVLGIVDVSFNGSVTIALAANPSGGALAGTLTVNAVNGVATFANLRLDRAGDGYALSASANGLQSASSDPFAVTPQAATQLVVQLPLGNVLTGVPFDVRVVAQDARGNPDPTFTGPVTLSLSANPTGATLGGTLTVNAVNGVASFGGLTVNRTGTGYALRATTTAVGPSAGTSAAFGVSADQLVVTTQAPGTVTAGGGFGLAVTAKNSSGAADASFAGNVTVSLLNFGDGTPTLGGTLTVQAVNGVATFAGLSVNQAGVYLLAVSGGGVGGGVSNLFSVTGGPAPAVTSKQFQAASAPHSIRFTFDQDVSASLDPADLVLTNLTTGQTFAASKISVSWNAATKTAVFGATGATGGVAAGALPAGRYRATLTAGGVTNAAGSPLAADVTLEFNFLPGDANGDGAIDFRDLVALAQNYGRAPRDFSQGDFNYDGTVDFRDLVVLAQGYNTSLPATPVTAPPGGQTSVQPPVMMATGGDNVGSLAVASATVTAAPAVPPLTPGPRQRVIVSSSSKRPGLHLVPASRPERHGEGRKNAKPIAEPVTVSRSSLFSSIRVKRTANRELLD